MGVYKVAGGDYWGADSPSKARLPVRSLGALAMPKERPKERRRRARRSLSHILTRLPPPASSKAADQLPEPPRRVKAPSHKAPDEGASGEQPCGVCVEGQTHCGVDGAPFRVGDAVMRLPCGHLFHKCNILPFLLRCRQGGYCPYDGTPVARADVPLLPAWTVRGAGGEAAVPRIRSVPRAMRCCREAQL